VQINVPLVHSILKAADEVAGITEHASSVRTMDILRWPGVVNITETELDKVKLALVELFTQALQSLVELRAREGQALQGLLEQRLDAIDIEVDKVKQWQPEVLAAHKEKLMRHLNEAKIALDQNRLEQEMVLLAQKIDIAEELDRLDTHVKEVRRVLKQGGVIGRRLDFLMQELNREANTLSSKSINTSVTQAAVEMKVLIEQMREQVQNIE